MTTADSSQGSLSIVGRRRRERQARRVIRGVGWALIGVQLIGLLIWSVHLDDRASMSWDFGVYYQPWWSVAHLHLNPATTVVPGGYKFWQNDGELIVWVLAPLYWLFPNHELGFWWLQDLALVGVSVVGYRWIGELVPWGASASIKKNLVPATAWLVAALLLVLNPWTYWSASFAVQMEPFGVVFALLAARALTQRRRTLWLWCGLTVLCGAASALYVAGVGLMGIAQGLRRWYPTRRNASASLRPLLGSVNTALRVLLFSAIWVVALGAVGGTRAVTEASGVIHQGLAYLDGSGPNAKTTMFATASHALAHPGAVARVLGSHALNLWANIAPAGLVGLLTASGFFLSAPTLLENSLLKTQAFSYPGFANLIVYPAVAIGSALVVVAVMRRHRSLGFALAGLVIANAIVWCAVWLPKTGGQYVAIAPPAAQLLKTTANEIPSTDEVIASQGFVGVFSGRSELYTFGSPRSDLAGPEVFPIRSRVVWFVISAGQGIELPSTAETDQALRSIAMLPGARLVRQSSGVWIFRWTPPESAATVSLGGEKTVVPGWASAGTAARPTDTGTPELWAARSTGEEGYVMSGDIWRLTAGRYVTRIAMSTNRPTNVEVWDDSSAGDKLLARRVVRSARSRTVVVPFEVGAEAPSPGSSGPAFFDYQPQASAFGSTVEVRVWVPEHTRATVGSVTVASRQR